MLTLLAFLCPPLAVLATGQPLRAVGNVGLTALLYVPGVIHALSEVDRYRLARYSDSLMRAVARDEVARCQAA